MQIRFELTGKGVAWERYAVVVDGNEIGTVTFGMFSPTTKKYLGMALVSREFSSIDTEIEILVREKPIKAKVVKKPFYIPAYRRK